MSALDAPTRDGLLASPAQRDFARKWLALVVVLGLAVAVRAFVVANTDVSWEITLAEKILDGRHLYTDVFEINPPASTFLYLPAVALARAFGWTPEIAVDAFVFLGALLSLAITGAIVRRHRLLDRLDGWNAAAFALAMLTILPAQTFGEREHIALIAVFPALAVCAARGKGMRPLPRECVAAGVGAGLTLCIKPHFALAIAFAAAAMALYRRSWRTLFAPENLIAAAIAAAYGIAVVTFYGAFFTDVMPLVRDVYLPVRLSLVKTLIDTPVVLWFAAALIVFGLRRDAKSNPVFAVLLAASAGFAAAYVIQGKGWPYQSYPMLALALIALYLADAFRRAAGAPAGPRADFKRLCATVVLGVIAVWSFAWLNLAFDTGAAAALVKRIAPPHPSIVIVSDDIAVGHPLARAVQGRWMSRFCSLWVTQNAAVLRATGGLDPATQQRLSNDMAAERERLIGEIRDGKPDVIVLDQRPGRIAVDGRGASWSEWLRADPELSALVAANYRDVGSADDLAILRRNGS